MQHWFNFYWHHQLNLDISMADRGNLRESPQCDLIGSTWSIIVAYMFHSCRGLTYILPASLFLTIFILFLHEYTCQLLACIDKSNTEIDCIVIVTQMIYYIIVRDTCMNVALFTFVCLLIVYVHNYKFQAIIIWYIQCHISSSYIHINLTLYKLAQLKDNFDM